MYDVLEHLLDPKALLTTLANLTEKDAKIFISTNALDNWSGIPEAPDGFEGYYLRLAHTYSFTSATLEAILNLSGWEVLHRTLQVPKGDQWVIAQKKNGQASIAVPREKSKVLGYIDFYKKKVAHL
jgi:hypothetical protein